MSAPNRIYIHTDAHDDTYYELSDCCDDEVDYIRADIHEAEIDALHAENARLTALLEPQKVIKPDWKDAPAWANWYAKDSNGQRHWFEFEPEEKEEGFWFAFGRCALIRCKEWERTKQERPK